MEVFSMKTLKTLGSYLAAMLLVCPVAQAQLGTITDIAKKASNVTKGKKSLPAKDAKTADVKKAVPVKAGPKKAEPIKTADTKKADPVVERDHPIKADDRNKATQRPDGKPRDLHVANRNDAPMDIHHRLAGGRRVEVTRADHSRVVAEGGRRGFVERPYLFHGHEFAHRTYFVNGRAYDRFYGRFEYRGAVLAVYAPVSYYPTAFYTWAYYPWAAPVPYAWAWAGNPWFAYYGAYFTPYPVYANSSLWLTDYLISQSLTGAYEAQIAAQVALNQPLPPGQVILTSDVKQAIADEVGRQVRLEFNEAQQNSQHSDFDPASSSVATLLTGNAPRVFVAGTALDLVDSTGDECAVTEGDVLQFTPRLPQTADAATLMILAAKGGMECRPGHLVTVPYADLQEMQNHMRETVDDGLATLQSRQSGLPAPPQAATVPATQASFENGAPPPEPGADAQIGQQYQDAEKAEQDALSPGTVSAAIPATASQPSAVNLGMTVDQVVSTQGQPKMVADKGSQKIYIYERLKITFTDGKVSDIE
jgi:hypothetical protein